MFYYGTQVSRGTSFFWLTGPPTFIINSSRRLICMYIPVFFGQPSSTSPTRFLGWHVGHVKKIMKNRLNGPSAWSKRDTNMWPSCKYMFPGSWFCLKMLFYKGTFIWNGETVIWNGDTFIWNGETFIWAGGSFIWQEVTNILRRVTILLQIVRGKKFLSCVRTLTEEKARQ